MVGDYWLELRAHTTAETALALPRLWRVRMDEEGTLQVGGKPVDPISPTLFQQRDAEGLPPVLWTIYAPTDLGSRSTYASRVRGPANPSIIMPGLLACTANNADISDTHPARWRASWRCRFLVASPGFILLGTLVIPQFLGVNIDLEMFEGRDWRLRWNTLGGWLAVAGTALACWMLASGRTTEQGPGSDGTWRSFLQPPWLSRDGSTTST